MRHATIDTQHVLFGLVEAESSMAAAMLKGMGISLEALESEIKGIAPAGTLERMPKKLPMTSDAKKYIEYAMEVARQRRMQCVGTIDVLLGILRSGRGAAAVALSKHGVTEQRVLAQLHQTYGDVDPMARVENPSGKAPEDAMRRLGRWCAEWLRSRSS
jgi:ATP-dependent Clp protease ATP-binding subunit ClpC